MIGQSLAQYRIVAAIGACGMGSVFRARNTELDRDVAIKVLPTERAQVARFPSTLKVAARAREPVASASILKLSRERVIKSPSE